MQFNSQIGDKQKCHASFLKYFWHLYHCQKYISLNNKGIHRFTYDTDVTFPQILPQQDLKTASEIREMPDPFQTFQSWIPLWQQWHHAGMSSSFHKDIYVTCYRLAGVIFDRKAMQFVLRLFCHCIKSDSL